MLSFRKPTIKDLVTYFKWVNDPLVREQSYNSELISLESHQNWFKNAIESQQNFMCIFQDFNNENIGQVRIQKQKVDEALISVSIDAAHRSKGYAKEMIIKATDSFLMNNVGVTINAYIKLDNLSSKFSFEKAGYKFIQKKVFKGNLSYHYAKS